MYRMELLLPNSNYDFLGGEMLNKKKAISIKYHFWRHGTSMLFCCVK